MITCMYITRTHAHLFASTSLLRVMRFGALGIEPGAIGRNVSTVSTRPDGILDKMQWKRYLRYGQKLQVRFPEHKISLQSD